MLDGLKSMFRERGKVRTDLWCHDCRNDFSVALDYDLDGNHVIDCPHCGHEHCRVIKDGMVTGDRWDQRNGAAGNVYSYASGGSGSTGTVWLAATNSTSTTCTFLAASWTGTTTS